ncbi:hypothetical protein [Kitasatospora sp. A2-31]|uniref:hypothetical protein n=1 Tax=Kitasatospora sp. A2-31 TaxID=2916414 RepID=UPI001EE7ADCE|nr:hypothetical protein [Kitasatospora sp. A2-31]MCG6493525.1 hypothetical protein [Kitasatospora sp. A2-31]
MSTIAPVLDGTVVLSTGAALALAPRVLRPGARPGHRTPTGPDARLDTGPRPGRAPGPEALLALVGALFLLNQLAFAVHVRRVHDGSTAFIARHLPPGWFEVPRDSRPIDWLAAHTPAPELLAPSVLRVQAFLELPLVLLAFAAVLRRLDRSLYTRVAASPLLPLAAASYTAAFCAVEWDLRNPYTVDDIALRIASALLTPLLLARIAAHEPDTAPAAPRPVVFAVELWAYGQLMLVLYDTVLLYNLARLDEQRLSRAFVALSVLGATRFVPRSDRPPGPRVTALADALGRGLVLFFVPALAVRYAGSFGTPALAAAAGAVVLVAATARHAARLALPAAAGAAAGCLTVLCFTDPYYEAALLRAAVVALGTTGAVCALLDASRKPLDALS